MDFLIQLAIALGLTMTIIVLAALTKDDSDYEDYE